MKKRLLSILLTVVMVLSLLPTAAFAVTVDNTYQPGTYVASAPGHDDALVSVTLTLAQQDETVVISDLQADGSTQTPRFWAMVEEAGLLDSIRNANGTTGVDVVSGATQSSRAVLSAVEQALSQATSTISGSGTASDPYQIVTAAQLTAFAAAVDGGNTYAGQYVALGASIDLSGIDSWNPIGTEEGAAVFQGTFDGRGYTISGLTITRALPPVTAIMACSPFSAAAPLSETSILPVPTSMLRTPPARPMQEHWPVLPPNPQRPPTA